MSSPDKGLRAPGEIQNLPVHSQDPALPNLAKVSDPFRARLKPGV
jgi:hypothetical protein